MTTPASGQPSSTVGLLARRRFAPLFVVQFGGALNDNILRNAVVALITFGFLSEAVAEERPLLIQAALGLFILPFFLFSASAGRFADDCPDRALPIKVLKLGEIGSMAVAAFGLAFESVGLLLLAIFLAGLQSALFGPFKYALLPRLLERRELLAGNALLNASTYVAILLGIFWGTELGSTATRNLGVTGVVIVVAALGFASSLWLPPIPGSSGKSWRESWSPNFIAEIAACYRSMAAAPGMLVLIGLISWFWMFGAVILAQLPLIVRDLAGYNQNVYMFLLLVVCLGIAAGSLLSLVLHRGAISTRFVPMGMAVAAFGCLLPVLPSSEAPVAAEQLGTLAEYLSAAGSLPLIATLGLISVAMGVYIIPLYTTLQVVAPPDSRGRMIAANNICNAFLIVSGVLLSSALVSLVEPLPQALENLFTALGLGGFVVAVFGARALERVPAPDKPAADMPAPGKPDQTG